MLMGLKQPLVVEDRFPLLLKFDQAEQTLVQVVVQMVDT
jgi:copper(I)-binding protein